jgi:DNA-binding MarR family transcriptional regulator
VSTYFWYLSPVTESSMTEPRWLDDREARAWRGYERMQTRLEAQLARDLQRDCGMSMADFEVLVHLSESPEGVLRVFELGGAMEWEKSRLSHHLSRMERRGLVSRKSCDTDARGAYVALTEQGRKAIEDAAPQHVEHVRRYLIDVLEPRQLDALGEISESVLERLCGPGGSGASN